MQGYVGTDKIKWKLLGLGILTANIVGIRKGGKTGFRDRNGTGFMHN